MSGNGLLHSFLELTPPAPAATAWIAAPRNTAPTLAQPISVNHGASVTGATASLSVLGRDNAGEAKLIYKWSVSAAPSGGSAAFGLNNTNAAKNTTVTFTKAGAYTLAAKIIDAGGLSVNTTKKVTVASVAAGISVKTSSGLAIPAGSTFQFSGVRQAFVAKQVDQFGKPLANQSALKWSAAAIPAGASTPTFKTVQGVTTVTFSAAGSYTLVVRAANKPSVSTVFAVRVNQTLSSIALSPNAPSVYQGSSQQFTAQGFDQFGKPLSSQPAFTWSAGKGTITATGLFTAPTTGASCTVTARSGSISKTTSVTLLASNSSGYQNAALGSLVTTLDADGSINRSDMIRILRSVGGDGVVDAGEFTDLKTILTKAASLNIPEYVQVLAGDIVKGNLANATFQGQSLGNLSAGSSSTQLNKLVDKWFYGADRPAISVSSAYYQATAGSLFAHTPSHTDEYQGYLGDCYYLTTLGSLADSNPAAVQNMFLDNGDGTFTVRFYTGTYAGYYNSDWSISYGFAESRGTADYVTVDRMLPATSSGMLVYANYGDNVRDSSNTLWIPLAEKAYAQWNETGKEGRDGRNAYASIEGGWMGYVNAQILGYNSTSYVTDWTSQQTVISALAAHKAVTTGTYNFSGTRYGLYGNHAYAFIGYNASTDTFTLYNPWGCYQPEQLSWSQIRETCEQVVLANTSGTVAIRGAAAASVSVWAPAPQHRTDLSAVMPSFPSTDDFFRFDPAETSESLPAKLSASPIHSLLDEFSRTAAACSLTSSHPRYQSNPICYDLSAFLTDATFSDNDPPIDDLISEISLDWASEPLAV